LFVIIIIIIIPLLLSSPVVQKVTLKESYSKYRVGWMLNTESNECILCGDGFGYVYPRRHHCRLCGGLFCDNCSSVRLKLPELVEDGGSRSCLRCYSDLLKYNYHNEQKRAAISTGVDKNDIDKNHDNDVDKNNDVDHDNINDLDHDNSDDLDNKNENKITINDNDNDNDNDNIPTTYDDDKENTYQDRNVVSTPNPSSSSMMSILKITRNEGCWEYDDDSNATLTPLSAIQVLTPLSEF